MGIELLGGGAAALLFVAIIVALDVGRRVGLRRLAADPEGASAGTGAVEGAVFALLGLLIAFTFTGAAGRFDTRRQLVADEANDVGTAWLRLDMLPAEDQPALRGLFREYLAARVAVHQLLPDVQAAEAEQAHAVRLQGEIWALGTASVAKDGRPQVATLVLPAFNSMFDIATTRVATARMHVPGLIIGVLLGLTLLAALLAGYAMASPRSRSWLHMLAFAGIMALTVYVILDLEFPRAGFIKMSDADAPMIELLDSLK